MPGWKPHQARARMMFNESKRLCNGSGGVVIAVKNKSGLPDIGERFMPQSILQESITQLHRTLLRMVKNWQHPGSLPFVMAGFAAYGAGLGLFIAPNNSATLGAAPAEHAGQAGGLLNLMRAFGTGTGVAAASALLAWRLELATGVHERTVAVGERALLGAAGDVMPLLAALAVVAGIASSLRDRPRAPASPDPLRGRERCS